MRFERSSPFSILPSVFLKKPHFGPDSFTFGNCSIGTGARPTRLFSVHGSAGNTIPKFCVTGCIILWFCYNAPGSIRNRTLRGGVQNEIPFRGADSPGSVFPVRYGEAKEYKEFKLAAVFQTAIRGTLGQGLFTRPAFRHKRLGITYEFAEKVGAADFERVLREYAERGFDLIVGDAFLAGEEPSRRVAGYPETAFAFGSEFAPQEPNYSVFDNWITNPHTSAASLPAG